MKKYHPLIIIGSGPAGLTAGIYAARANLKPLIIKGPNPGGQLMGTSIVENWPGIKSILGPDLMQQMEEHAASFHAEFLDDTIVTVDFQQRPFTLTTKAGVALTADAVIIASGSSPKKLGCPGEDTYWGKGVSTCAVCDGAFYQNQPVIIVGGGDSAMENVAFMLNFTNNITLVTINSTLSASHALQEKIVNNPHIRIIYNSTVSAIEGDGHKVTTACITDKLTHTTQRLAADAIFLSIGLLPNVDPFRGQIAITPYGFIQVENNTHTSVPGVFCAGDVFNYQYRQAITAAGNGCMAALDAEKYLKTLKKETKI